MRILVLSSVLPFPPDDGGRIRVFHLLRGLAEVHDVELLTLTDDSDGEREGHAVLAADGVGVHAVSHRPDRRAVSVRSLLTGRSFHGDLVRSAALRARLRERLAGGDIDVVQCEYAAMARYRRWDQDVPWVLDAHNVEFRISDTLADSATGARQAPYRMYARREARCRRREEIAAWRDMEHVVVVSGVDREIVAAIAPDTPTTVVPNGVDLEHLRPPPERTGHRPAAVFVGKMDYRPNVDGVRWFADEMLPLVRARVPSFELTIVGRDPTPAVRALGDRPGVHVTGPVLDAAPLLHDAALAVVPLRAGSGTRLKVLEALATGTPVVSTSVGVEGLDLEPGRHVVVADDPHTFATAVVELMADPGRRADLASAGRRLVEERFGWPHSVAALVAVHERVVDLHRSGGHV
ncbi:MAG: glycosyltransferase [Acidimicrobiales bacterium]